MYLDEKPYMYGFIWPYVLIYTVCIDPRGAHKFNPTYNYPGNLCILHLVDPAKVKYYLITMLRAAVQVQLSMMQGNNTNI